MQASSRLIRTLGAALLAGALILMTPVGAQAHRERSATFPEGGGRVPSYRTDGPYLVVCARDSGIRIATQPKRLRKPNQVLLAECRRDGFQSLQAAVDAVSARGTRILVLPGVYREEASLEPVTAECLPLADPKVRMTYEQQVACRHVQNLVAILGDGPDPGIACDDRLCDLQIEGTGARPEDVIFDGGFRKHVVIRADRADGIYFRNFTVQRAPDYGLYVIETDGFVVDRMLGRWNEDYGFLTFADDHGKYVDCEAHGNGDSGLYPGAASPQYGLRHAIEITRCASHHNFAGLGGTAGNSLLVHDNDFYDNTVGVALDSVFPNHPGHPQGHSVFRGNRIYENNADFYPFHEDGTCQLPPEERGLEDGVVCPTVGGPTGSGVLLAGGNHNTFEDNWVWGNERYGFMQLWVPAYLRGESDPALLFDTSHHNHYVHNHLGTTPDGRAAPNGVDYWWDEEGIGNCWEGPATSDPAVLPDCAAPAAFTPPNLAKSAVLLACLAWAPGNLHPVGCPWFSTP